MRTSHHSCHDIATSRQRRLQDSALAVAFWCMAILRIRPLPAAKAENVISGRQGGTSASLPR
ncbi:hypothetical protein HMPREF9946_04150 [Acetobacteraceae bacterium AT-5844]|nr:hypothetical protein HMPREF9946_04150 [Acetobacteraceae bacterium AT-5844]